MPTFRFFVCQQCSGIAYIDKPPPWTVSQCESCYSYNILEQGQLTADSIEHAYARLLDPKGDQG